MRDVFPFFDVLVIPLDAGPNDARIEIDGLTGEIRVYDSNGDLVGSWDSAEFKINHPTSGSYVLIDPSNAGVAAIFFHSDDLVGYAPGSLSAGSDGLGTPFLLMPSPAIVGETESRITLYGENSAANIRPAMVVDVGNGEISQIQSGDIGVVAGGYRKDNFATSSSAATTAEAVVLTIANMNFRDGRAYRVTYGDGTFPDAANTEVIYRLRKTNVAGTIYYQSPRFFLPTNGQVFNSQGTFFLRRAKNAGDLTTNVVLTMLSAAGGNVAMFGSATQRRYCLIEDVGSANAYQFAFTVT